MNDGRNKPVRLLALNGSVRGDGGDGAQVLDAALAHAGDAAVTKVTLASYTGTIAEMTRAVTDADAFLLATGTYWGSWGSPLQRFLEVMTALEATDAFVGKPAAALVTMDSVGGSDVGARLLLALATMGCALPPFPLVVLSRTGVALAGRAGFEDVWQAKDLEVLVHNLVAAVGARERWRRWSVERAALPDGPWPAGGALDLGLPRLDDEPR